MEFFIHKENGVLGNTRKWDDYLKSLEDGKYRIEIKPYKKRSLQQNSYYWAVVVPLVYDGLRSAGFEAVRNQEDAHLIMKSLFLKLTEEKSGLKIEKILSTTELTKTGFAEYLMHIFTWSFDYLGISIPQPDEQMEFQL